MHALYEQGATLKEVGEEFGLTGERVGQLLRRAGLKTRSTKETLAIERKHRAREMHELYLKGATVAQVAEEFGLTDSGVRYLFGVEGFELRSREELVSLRRELDTRPREMYELYERGATMTEVGKTFGVSQSRVSQIFQEAGYDTRQAAEHPVAEMYEIYKLGATLSEVGEEFSMRSQRVFEIFKQAGLRTRSNSQTLELKNQANNARADEVIELFREKNDPRAVARELEIPLAHVRGILREHMKGGEYLAHLYEDRGHERFSDDELLEFLRRAQRFLGRVLSAKDYTEYADGRRTPRGHRWPTKETHIHRFGSWRKALFAAGLDAHDPLKIAKERPFTAEDCLGAIRRAHRDLGRIPTRREYAAYAQASKRTRPGLAVISRRCGTWTETLRKAGL